MRTIFAILAALVCTLCAISAAAQVDQLFEEFGVSPRDSAMGCAFTAVADDFSAAYYNPAGLYQIEGSHIHMGYRVVDPVLKMRFVGRNVPADLADYPSTEMFLLGFSSDLELSGAFSNAITDRINFGLAIAFGEYLKSYTSYWDVYTPYYYRYYDRMVSLFSIYAGISIQLTDWLAVGAAIVPAPADAFAHADVRTDIYLPAMETVSRQGTVTRAIGKIEPLAGVYMKWPGLAWRDRLAWGMTWRDHVDTSDGEGEAVTNMVVHFPDGSTYSGLDQQVIELYQLTGWTPMQVAVGAMVKPLPSMTVAVDGVWKNWREWQNFFKMTPSPRFHDTYIGKLGIEQVFSFEQDWFQQVALRGGYYYEPSPAPQQNGQWNILDNDKHVASLGLGLQVSDLLGVIVKPVRLDFAYQEHILVPQRVDNYDDPQFGPIETGGHLWSFAGTVNISF